MAKRSGSTEPVYLGQVLAGRYRVDRVLGAGGMGVVVEAYHLELQQRVAIKLMLRDVAEKPEMAARFMREARAAVRLQSDHVARVLDVGRLETGEPFMVMEYLSGQDLSALVRSEGALPVQQVVDYVLQASEAVAEAHSQGVVHRDLKPSNLFLTKRADGTALIKVLDFGISKVTSLGGGPETDITSTAALLGSPAYMAPEQMRSAKSVDARADIWALGVILYELLTGRQVYEAESLAGLIAMIATDPPTAPRVHRPDLPESLEAVVLKCLEKQPAGRYKNMGELATALAPFASSDGETSIKRVVRVLRTAGLTSLDTNRPPAAAAEDAPAGAKTASTFGVTAQSKKPKGPVIAAVVGASIAITAASAFAWIVLRAPSVPLEPVAPVQASETVAAAPAPNPELVPELAQLVPAASSGPAASSSAAAAAGPTPTKGKWPIPTGAKPATPRPEPSKDKAKDETIPDLSERK